MTNHAGIEIKAGNWVATRPGVGDGYDADSGVVVSVDQAGARVRWSNGLHTTVTGREVDVFDAREAAAKAARQIQADRGHR
jgi:hypothetical protein